MAVRKNTVKQVAETYGRCEETVRRWITEGKIQAEKDPSGYGWLIPVNDKGEVFST